MKSLFSGIGLTLILSSLASCTVKDEAAKEKENLSTEVIAQRDDGKSGPATGPEITFDYLHVDLGKAKEGDVMKHEFFFTNTGVNKLIINNVKPTCGCTIPYFPKEPVEPGEKGSIKIEFSTSGRIGHQEKSLTVYSNTIPNKTKLTFTADVYNK